MNTDAKKRSDIVVKTQISGRDVTSQSFGGLRDDRTITSLMYCFDAVKQFVFRIPEVALRTSEFDWRIINCTDGIYLACHYSFQRTLHVRPASAYDARALPLEVLYGLFPDRKLVKAVQHTGLQMFPVSASEVKNFIDRELSLIGPEVK